MNCLSRPFLIPVLAAFLLFSCKEEAETPFANPTQIDRYFPVSDFLEQKITERAGVAVTKTIRFNDEVEEVSFQPDKEAWRKELDFFFQADINKAALASAYDTSEEEGRLIHKLKPGEKGIVQQILVQKKGNRIEEIRIETTKNNLFYQSQVKGTIVLDDKEDLVGYRLRGSQKVWFMPPTALEVEAKVGG
jgi:hypothetical protein